MFPFMAEIEVSFPLKHEYEAKEASGDAGGAGGPGGGKPGGAAAAANGKTENNKSTPDDKSK